MILFSQLETGDVERVVAGQAAFFSHLGQDVEWKLYGHDPSAHLSSALAAHGFQPNELETLMALDLAGFAAESDNNPDIDVRAVRTDGDLRLYIEVTSRAFGHPSKSSLDWAPQFFGAGTDTFAFIAYLCGKPVAAGRLQLPPARSFASLWGGGTDPALRKRGTYRALVAARADFARHGGYRYLTVDARETSRPILERLGFVALTNIRAWNFCGRRKSAT